MSQRTRSARAATSAGSSKASELAWSLGVRPLNDVSETSFARGRRSTSQPRVGWYPTGRGATQTTHLTDTLRLHRPPGPAFAWPQPVEIVTAAQHLSSDGDPGRGIERTAPLWSDLPDRPFACPSDAAGRARSTPCGGAAERSRAEGDSPGGPGALARHPA